jgi:quaternary ammonium compound-resistance protein SugE
MNDNNETNALPLAVDLYTFLPLQKLHINSPHKLIMNWIILIIAGLFEVAFAFCLGKAKVSTGAVATWWLMGFFITLSISMYLLYRAIQTLPIGTSYAVWTGIGAVGTVLVGIIIFDEPADFWRLFFISTLVISIVGLRVVTH